MPVRMMRAGLLLPGGTASRVSRYAGRLPAIAVSERIFRVPAASLDLYKAGRLRRVDLAPLNTHRLRPRVGPSDRPPVLDVQALRDDLEGLNEARSRR
jgi:hypothetical protein